MLSIVAAALGGLIFGIGGVLGLQLVTTSIQREEELRRYRLPVLARIPLEQQRSGFGRTRWLDEPLGRIRDALAGRSGRSNGRGGRSGRIQRKSSVEPNPISRVAADSYGLLAASVVASRRDEYAKYSIVVTGPTPSDGKTTTSLNLAASLSAMSKRVVLIEADLRRPSLGAAVGLEPSDGLDSVISGRVELADALVEADRVGPRLQMLLQPPNGPPASAVMTGEAVDRVVSQGELISDWVIFDGPPPNYVSDGLTIAKRVDLVILVVRLRHTGASELAELAELLAQQGITPLGFVVIGGKDRSAYYGY